MASRTAPQHRADGEQRAGRGAGSCASRALAQRVGLGLGAAHRGPAPQRSRRACRAMVERIGGDDERPGVHSRRHPLQPRLDLVARELGAHPHQHDRAEQQARSRAPRPAAATASSASIVEVPRTKLMLCALVERVPPDHRIMDDRQVDRADQAEDRGEPPLPAFLLLGAGERDDSRDRGRAGRASRSSARPIPNRCPRSAGPRASRWRGRWR